MELNNRSLEQNVPERDEVVLITNSIARREEERIDLRDEDRIDLREYLSIFSRRRLLIFLLVLSILALGVMYTYTRRPIYKSTTSILVTQQSTDQGDSEAPVLETMQALNRGRTIETQVQILSSPDILEEAFSTISPALRRQAFGSTVFSPDMVTIASKQGTDIIDITVRSHVPAVSAELANTIAETYFAIMTKQDAAAYARVLQSMEQNSLNLAQNLNTARRQLTTYRQKTGVIATSIDVEKVATRRATIQEALDDATSAMAGIDHSLQMMRQTLNTEQREIITETTVTRSPQYTALVEEIESLYRERSSLLEDYLPTSDAVASIDRRIRTAEARLQRTAELRTGSQSRQLNPVLEKTRQEFTAALAQRSVLEARTSALQNAYQRNEAKAQLLPEHERKISEYTLQVQALERTYDLATSRYYDMLANQQTQFPAGRIVARARAPYTPERSHTVSLVFFATLALLLSGIAAIAFDRVAAARKREDESTPEPDQLIIRYSDRGD